MKKRWILAGALIVVTVTVVVISRLPDFPAAFEPEAQYLSVSADHLADAFERDEDAANVVYLNKQVKVSGIVKANEDVEQNGTSLTLHTGDRMTAVQCVLRSKRPGLKPGQRVHVLGTCAGYVNHVVLNDCTVIDK